VLGDGPPEEMLRSQRAMVLRSLMAAPASATVDPSQGAWLRWLWLPALGAAAIVAVVVTSRLGGPLSKPVAVGPTVAQGSAESPIPAVPIEDRWLEAALEADLSVPLADGSEVRVGRGAKGRLQRFSPRRVRVTVESGRMDLTVRPGVGNEWSVHAGAYRVNVIGTEFFVNYRPDADSVEVGVAHGRVSVSGGHLGNETVTLGPGNRLRAERGSVELAPTAAALPLEPAVAPPSTPAPPEPNKRRTEAAPVPPRAVGWQTQHAAGNYAGALAEAERDGFDRLVRQLRVGDLADLADVARLAGDQARARQALMAARARFPQATYAATAAFLLGRMAADVAADLPAAARWFETSLKEQPQGAYAAEARGRLMTVLDRQGDRSRAAAVADEYLRRHPNGPYRDVARSLAASR
jgi:TolA-binding protein